MARLPIENGYLFVHIPKTAGTSFRDSLNEIFGDGLYCDYGPDETTSAAVVDYIHKRQEFPEFGAFLAEQNKPICVSGHYPIKKYGPFFYVRNIMLFLRDPIQRAVSQYEHMRRVDGLNESFESFCAKPAHVNLQTRNIGRASFRLIGFIGLQEYYRESLQLLSSQNGLRIKESFLNINEQRASVKYQLDSEMLALLEKNNEKDLALYQSVKTMFLQRYELFAAGKPYVHGLVTSQNSNKVTGWAINQNSELPIELTVYVDELNVGSLIANSYRHDLREWNVGRQGYVGFEFSFKKPLSPESKVECVVAETGQSLFNPF